MAISRNLMQDLSAPPVRRVAGIRLRGLARMLLVSWLFTLLVCFYGDFSAAPVDSAEATPVAHEHNDYSKHGDNAQDTDVCCAIQQNLPAFFKMGSVEAPLQYLMYVLLPFVFVVHATLLSTARVCFFCTDPPGKLSPLLTANALWPNAPPR